MEFSFTSQNGIGIFELKGNLIGENDGMAIAEAFSEKLEDDISDFVISLEALNHINSSGLGVLITLLTKARRGGGDLVLSSPSDFIKNLLLITKLNTIFKIYPTLEEAVESYKPQ